MATFLEENRKRQSLLDRMYAPQMFDIQKSNEINILKGEHQKHKYLRKENGKYIYAEGKEKESSKENKQVEQKQSKPLPTYKEATKLPKGGAVAMGKHNLQATAADMIAGRHSFKPESVYNWANKYGVDLKNNLSILGDIKNNDAFMSDILNDRYKDTKKLIEGRKSGKKEGKSSNEPVEVNEHGIKFYDKNNLKPEDIEVEMKEQSSNTTLFNGNKVQFQSTRIESKKKKTLKSGDYSFTVPVASATISQQGDGKWYAKFENDDSVKDLKDKNKAIEVAKTMIAIASKSKKPIRFIDSK